MKEEENPDKLLIQKIEAWRKTSPAALALTRLCQEEMIPAYFFGGVCRSCWNKETPRDIDIVVDDLRWDDFLKTIPGPIQENRFGGIKFQLEGTSIDAWPVGKTWAFAEGLSYPNSANILPETTFLNIESVVALIWHPDEPWVFEKGFYRAMRTRTLEIQNPHNPYPALCIARIQKFLDSGWIAGESVRAFESYHRKNGSTQADIDAARNKHYR